MMMLTSVIQTTVTTTAQSSGNVLSSIWNWSGWGQLDSISAVIVVVFATVGGVLGFIKPYRQLRRECRKYLKTYYRERLTELSRYYIHTRGQDSDPCNYDSPADNNRLAITQNLIPHFLKDPFSPECREKVFLILADSGMGKTTFLLKLYQTYARRLFIRGRKWIYHINLADVDCLNKIQAKKKEDEEKHRTSILLLDSLDEQRCNLADAKQFLKDVLNASESFYRIVITCRTQYFEDAREERFRVPFIRVDGNDKNYHLVIKYLSPFSDKEADLYLKKKFRLNFKKRKQAKAIVEKAPTLAARPMILSWIDELCDDTEQTYAYSCQIYARIVDKWLKREARELVRNTSGEVVEDKEERLRSFCHAAAAYMWKNDTDRIPKADLDTLARGIDLAAMTARSRTLLNRDSEGNCKFAHKSFYEYFISWLWHHEYDRWKEEDWTRWTDGMRAFMGEESAIKVETCIRNGEKALDKCLICLDFKEFDDVEWIQIRRKLRGTDLRGADLRGAALSEATLRGIDLRGAKLSAAVLRMVNRYKIRYDGHTDFTDAKLDNSIEELVKINPSKQPELPHHEQEEDL